MSSAGWLRQRSAGSEISGLERSPKIGEGIEVLHLSGPSMDLQCLSLVSKNDLQSEWPKYLARDHQHRECFSKLLQHISLLSVEKEFGNDKEPEKNQAPKWHNHIHYWQSKQVWKVFLC